MTFEAQRSLDKRREITSRNVSALSGKLTSSAMICASFTFSSTTSGASLCDNVWMAATVVEGTARNPSEFRKCATTEAKARKVYNFEASACPELALASRGRNPWVPETKYTDRNAGSRPAALASSLSGSGVEGHAGQSVSRANSLFVGDALPEQAEHPCGTTHLGCPQKRSAGIKPGLPENFNGPLTDCMAGQPCVEEIYRETPVATGSMDRPTNLSEWRNVKTQPSGRAVQCAALASTMKPLGINRVTGSNPVSLKNLPAGLTPRHYRRELGAVTGDWSTPLREKKCADKRTTILASGSRVTARSQSRRVGEKAACRLYERRLCCWRESPTRFPGLPPAGTLHQRLPAIHRMNHLRSFLSAHDTRMMCGVLKPLMRGVAPIVHNCPNPATAQTFGSRRLPKARCALRSLTSHS